jgi:hypothetical protein
VGRAASGLFEATAGSVRSIVVSAGHAVTCGEHGSLHVPKKELVAVLQVLRQGRRIQVASRLPLAETLVREMELFRATVKAAGSSADFAWRERVDDDLVHAVALAARHGERTTFDNGEPIALDRPGYWPAWQRW